MDLGATLAATNATLNATSAVLLVLGRRAIKQKKPALHKKLMLSAIAVSAVFLVSYLTRVAISGTHRYEGSAAMKALYLSILFSHMALAVVTPVFALRAAYVAWIGRLDVHRRIVRYAWPIWMYVSVTGVIVYLMLYRPWAD